MFKFLVIAALALGVTACDGVQEDVTNSDYVCKDGVEYFVYSKYSGNGYSYSVVPHYKPDGSLYTCTVGIQEKK